MVASICDPSDYTETLRKTTAKGNLSVGLDINKSKSCQPAAETGLQIEQSLSSGSIDFKWP